MEMAKVTSKGQITIPVSIRRRLQINEGDKLLFIDRPDGVMMVNPDLLGSGQEIEEAPQAAPKTRTTQPKPAASTTKPAEKPDVTFDAQLSDNDDSIPEPPPVTPRPSTDIIKEKRAAKVGDLNLDSLLDEIRSIGLKI